MLLVLSRRRNESIMIGDELLLTVAEIRSTRVSITLSRPPLAGRLSAFAETTAATLQRDQSTPLGQDASCTIVDIRGDKVRLGIDAPKTVSVHRKEVYDAIRRDSRGDDDDQDWLGSPVPR